MKKRIISLLLGFLILVSFSACGSNDTSPDPATPEAKEETNVIVIPKETKAIDVPQISKEPVVLTDNGTLGDYDVQIGDFKICDDYNGNPTIVVEFTYTNNSEENISAMLALAYSAYQNGIQLDSAIVMDKNIYNADDLMKEIQPGTTLSVNVPFALNSETAPVEFELTEAFSFTDEKLGKIFEIAENGITELSIAPNADNAEKLGNYAVSIVSYELAHDYNGKPVIVINLGFTNNSEKTTSYVSSISSKAFQDGIQLETAIVTDYEAGQSQMRDIRPGAGAPVCVAYLLTSETSSVQLEVEELFSFSGNKITAEIELSN